MESELWKENKEDGRGRKHEHASVQEDKNCRDANPLPIEKGDGDGFGFNPAPNKNDGKEGSIIERVNEDMEAQPLYIMFPPRRSNCPENETDSYTDKIVTEIKLSKPMDHFKKNVI